MTPEDRADFAAEIRKFSPKSIERLHRLLSRLQDESVVLTPDVVRREYHALCREDGHAIRPADSCLRWLLDLLDTDPETALNNKFLDVLHDARIVLTTDATTTDGGDQSPQRAASPHDDSDLVDRPASPDSPDAPDSPDSLDPDRDLLWQQAVALDQRKLVSQALEQWRQKLDTQRDAYLDHEDPAAMHCADAQYGQELARKSLSHWRHTMDHVRRIEKVAVKLRARRDAAFALKAWSLATREKIFTRVRDERLSHNALRAWRAKTMVAVHREIAAEEFCEQQAIRRVLARLTAKQQHLKLAETHARRVYDGMLMQKALDKWLPQLDQVQLNERRATAAAEFFAGKHALQVWHGKTLLKEEEQRSIRARHHVLAVKYLRKWRAAVKRSKESQYDTAYRRMRRKVKVNIARAALNIWRAKAARLRQMDPVAAEFRARKDAENARGMAHRNIITMYNKTVQMQEARQRAESFFHRHLVLRLRLFGATWLTPARRIRSNQQKADDYRATRTASYAVTAMRSWRNHTFRSHRLREDADVLWQRSAKKKALAYLSKWRGQAASRDRLQVGAPDRPLIPATPAARRSQLLASTTPAYTPAGSLFTRSRLVDRLDER